VMRFGLTGSLTRLLRHSARGRPRTHPAHGCPGPHRCRAGTARS
jgi:hypothetical protein